jgi:hypothetical protein
LWITAAFANCGMMEKILIMTLAGGLVAAVVALIFSGRKSSASVPRRASGLEAEHILWIVNVALAAIGLLLVFLIASG